MERITGTSVSTGIAIGRILFYYKEDLSITAYHVGNTDSEINRYNDARDKAVEQLDKLFDKVSNEIGENNAKLFEAHKMLVKDEEFERLVHEHIKKDMVNAESAVVRTANEFCDKFRLMDDPYLADRVADIRDIASRIVKLLLGGTPAVMEMEEPYVLVAEDLNPSDIFQFERDKLLGIVIKEGSKNSHVSILAHSMGIPAVIKANIFRSFNGKFAIVDGDIGEIIIDPDDDRLKIYNERIREKEEYKKLQKEMVGKPDVTRDGRAIKLYACINDDSDIDNVLANDAAGIGLFRTEFLYLKMDRFPTEEEQFQVYKNLAEKMDGKPVVIRTCDVGVDKTKNYMNLPKERNPALGCRGIRLSLARPELFITQLRAIYRASVYGNIGILYPMIVSVDEIREIKRMIETVKLSLKKDKYEYSEIKQGIMIETPAAALTADRLAREVDFLSVGTNDLTQYCLALDRQNSGTDTLFDREHPAVKKLMKHTIKCAHKEGLPVGICGEFSVDEETIRKFVKMGFDEITAIPSSILYIRRIINEI
ncbi:MAG: phosphoenolpyruvate--protein phosphotransferase [Lachnospiraceae bacterium]|nr:phosphoenolpyruvate--protein phosphotransferase [Lachnospiraceae bacterium]